MSRGGGLDTTFNPGGFNPVGFNPSTINSRNFNSQIAPGRTGPGGGAYQAVGGYAPSMPLSRGGATVAAPNAGYPIPNRPKTQSFNPCCGSGVCGDDIDGVDKNARLNEQSWMYVGEGSGTHEYVPSYVYVGKGAGAWVVDEKPVAQNGGQMFAWVCGGLLCFVLTAGLTWLCLSLFSGDLKSEEIPGLTSAQSNLGHLGSAIHFHGGNAAGHVGNGLSNAAGAAGEHLHNIHQAAKPHLNHIGDRVQHHAGNAWSKSKEHAGHAGNWVKDKVDEHKDTAKAHANKIANDAKELGHKANEAGKAGVHAGVHNWKNQDHHEETTEESTATEEPTSEEPVTSSETSAEEPETPAEEVAATTQV